MTRSTSTTAGRVIKFFLLGSLTLSLLILLLRTDYVLIKPGSAEDLRRLVTVEGAVVPDEGKFFLVTVSQQRANGLMALYGYLHPHIEVSRLEDVLPRGMDQESYRRLLEQWMAESKTMAQVIALRRAGYPVEIAGSGTEIVGFTENSPTEDILRIGDIIVEVDGIPVDLASEVISLVQDRSVGESVQLTILREEEKFVLEVPTGPHPQDPGLPALGVYIRTSHWEPLLPLRIEMETGQIGGPSAGVMFVLEILNQLTPEDLARGRFIAGTGTIDINENVGRIGGVFQKVIAAEKAGAEFFIVPRGNYEEALKAAVNLELVPVATLQEVLDFLETLAPPEPAGAQS